MRKILVWIHGRYEMIHNGADIVSGIWILSAYILDTIQIHADTCGYMWIQRAAKWDTNGIHSRYSYYAQGTSIDTKQIQSDTQWSRCGIWDMDTFRIHTRYNTDTCRYMRIHLDPKGRQNTGCSQPEVQCIRKKCFPHSHAA